MAVTRSTPLVFILNGPNLDILGQRQPELYGNETLQDVRELCERTATELEMRIDFRQTSGEGTLVEHIHDALTQAQAIVINPGAYAHTSIAVQDALHACDMPIYEVHITNTWRRESFRHTDYVAMVATGQLNGLGIHGYALALRQVASILKPGA